MTDEVRRPLILLHGALGSAAQLAALEKALLNDFELHVLDLPGHGDEPLGEQAFALASFVARVKSYIKQQDLQRAWIFGHSMGGLVGLLLALEESSLSGVITLGTKLGWTPEVAIREVSRLDADKIEEKVPAFGRALEQRHCALGWKRMLECTRTLTLELGEHPPLSDERLAEVHVPVFFGVAEGDQLVPHEEARRVVACLAQAELWTIAGAHPLESVEVDTLALQIKALTDKQQSSRVA